MKDLKVIIIFLFIVSVISTSMVIVTCKRGKELQQELKQVKAQRDTYLKAIIKGNDDILNARKIIQNKIHISI